MTQGRNLGSPAFSTRYMSLLLQPLGGHVTDIEIISYILSHDRAFRTLSTNKCQKYAVNNTFRKYRRSQCFNSQKESFVVGHIIVAEGE